MLGFTAWICSQQNKLKALRESQKKWKTEAENKITSLHQQLPPQPTTYNPPPTTQPSPTQPSAQLCSPLRRKQDEMTLCIWKCPERCLIYVCIRCKFYYGTQGGLRDFPLNTWLPWSNPISLIQTRGKDRRREEEKIGRNLQPRQKFKKGKKAGEGVVDEKRGRLDQEPDHSTDQLVWNDENQQKPRVY